MALRQTLSLSGNTTGTQARQQNADSGAYLGMPPHRGIQPAKGTGEGTGCTAVPADSGAPNQLLSVCAELGDRDGGLCEEN